MSWQGLKDHLETYYWAHDLTPDMEEEFLGYGKVGQLYLQWRKEHINRDWPAFRIGTDGTVYSSPILPHSSGVISHYTENKEFENIVGFGEPGLVFLEGRFLKWREGNAGYHRTNWCDGVVVPWAIVGIVPNTFTNLEALCAGPTGWSRKELLAWDQLTVSDKAYDEIKADYYRRIAADGADRQNAKAAALDHQETE